MASHARRLIFRTCDGPRQCSLLGNRRCRLGTAPTAALAAKEGRFFEPGGQTSAAAVTSVSQRMATVPRRQAPLVGQSSLVHGSTHGSSAPQPHVNPVPPQASSGARHPKRAALRGREPGRLQHRSVSGHLPRARPIRASAKPARPPPAPRQARTRRAAGAPRYGRSFARPTSPDRARRRRARRVPTRSTSLPDRATRRHS